MASAFLFCRVSIFLVFLIIPIPVVNSSNIPKTWQEFVQNCIASFASSSAKFDWDQGSEDRAQGSEEWDQGSQGF